MFAKLRSAATQTVLCVGPREFAEPEDSGKQAKSSQQQHEICVSVRVLEEKMSVVQVMRGKVHHLEEEEEKFRRHAEEGEGR